MEVVKGPDFSHEEMLAHLIAQYEVSVLRTCYMYLRDRQLAEDAKQETFLKAYKALHTFRGECNEKTWLMRIAINTCRDMKRSAYFRFVDRRVAVDELPMIVQNFDFGEADDLTKAIMELPSKYKEVILLHFYQDMTLREIAGTLGIAVSTVGKRIKVACSKLGIILEGGSL